MIPEVNPYNNYRGDGVATKFDYDFLIQDGSQLIVQKITEDDVAINLVNNVDYEIKEIGNVNGGYINFPLASSEHSILTEKETISLQLTLPFEQESEYGQSSMLNLGSLEFSLDYLTRLCQILKRQMERSVKVNEGNDIIDITLPPPKANNTFAWNEDCSALVNYDIIGENNAFKNEMVKEFQSARDEFNTTIATNKQEILDIQEQFEGETSAAIKEFEDGIDAKIATVADAADRINDLDNDLAIATNAANEAISQAQIATQQAQIITNKVDEVLNVKDELEAEIGAKANVDLSNLSSLGQSKFDLKADKVDVLNKSQITNCITEIPQRIKLELADGVLTLKAGSEVIVPNGFEIDGTTPKFDYVTIENDINRANATFFNSTSFVLYNTIDNIIFNRSVDICYSGDTAPSGETYMVWYDTTNNIVKVTSDSGASWLTGFSFPFGIVQVGSSAYTSIDCVYNGLGYIGSTIWCDKGVKALLRNGRNEDGTLKNIEYTVPKIQIRTTTSTTAISCRLVIHSDLGDGSFNAWWAGRVFEQAEEPTIWSHGGTLWVNPETNISKYHPDDDNADWIELPSAIVGSVSRLAGGAYGNLNANQTFRALNANGDTIAGDLIITKNEPPLVILKSHQDRSIPPTTSAASSYFIHADKNNQTIAQFATERYTDGRNVAKMQAFSLDGSTSPAIRVTAYANNTIGFDFPKCTTKATTASSAKSDLVAVVVQNYVSGTSWYRVWSDGWIEQGGVTSASLTATGVAVSLLKSFANTNYTVMMSYAGNVNNNSAIGISTKTTTSFKMHNANNNSVGAWYACGY